jgi:hypothetical protein
MIQRERPPVVHWVADANLLVCGSHRVDVGVDAAWSLGSAVSARYDATGSWCPTATF